MKAFLLAAGLGTRLRPLTDKVPKCLLPIGSKLLLEIWLELLRKHRVNEVLINTHWCHEKVEEFIDGRYRNKAKTGMWPEIQLFYEPDLLGSAGTLLANKDWVADGKPFFILYGDNLTNVDLTKIYLFHCSHALPFSLGVFRTATPKECGIAKINQYGVVTHFAEKPKRPKSDIAASGIYVADRIIFDHFPQEQEALRPLDLGFHLLPRMVGRMKAYCIKESLVDIGTMASYKKAQELWKVMRP
jgi:mannose-1-phosphate guanylyltransferase